MGEDMDVHLRWNHHQTTLLSVFSSLLDNGNLVDCTISAEGQHFKAHRVILSACSPYFELLFSEHCETHPVVILPDVKFKILEVLMEYMYSGEVKVPQDKLGIVLKLAETLQIKGLSSVSDSERKNSLGSKRKNESPILCDQQGFRKHLHEPGYDSQMEQKDFSSLQTSEKECSEDIDPFLQAVQKCEKNSSNLVSPEKTVEEVATLQEISDTEAFNVFRYSSVTKTLTKSNTCVSGTLLNSVSSISDSSQLLGSSNFHIGGHRTLSENVISTRSTAEKLRISEPLSKCGERHAVDLLPQIKQEAQDDFSGNSIEEIILDDDTDESDNHDHECGSGGDNKNIVGGLGRVIPEQSFSHQGFCSLEQYRDTYFVEPASILPKPFKCNDCGRSYWYQRGLTRHLKYECGKEPQFKCPQCPSKFFHKYHLRVHIVKIHPPC